MRGAKPAEEAFEALRTQLGAELPDGLRRLDGEQLAHLDAAVREARHRQAEALAAAGERALRHVPRLLRGPIRRITG
jgi:hypothetical protein